MPPLQPPSEFDDELGNDELRCAPKTSRPWPWPFEDDDPEPREDAYDVDAPDSEGPFEFGLV